jgi:predicted extracellular nuclease
MNKIILLFLLLLQISILSKNNDTVLVVAFYNLENLFDTEDDPETDDSEFLPESEKEWNQNRLERKMFNMARVIRTMNNSNAPDLIGVCEVEHQFLLDSMNNTFLKDKNYISISPNSPDGRGIQNGIMFKKNIFKLLEVYTDTVKLPGRSQTRLILGAALLFKERDTIFFFVNHWPSRRGGQEITEKNRIIAAKTLRQRVESILYKNNKAKIILAGDFNDEPNNISILEHLKAKPLVCSETKEINLSYQDDETDLFNLSYQKFSEGFGSFKFQDDWNMLDQIIVSRDLLVGKSINYICDSFEVYNPEFLVTRSGKFKGAPFPTYSGNRYLGGYSDHFAVLAKFIVKKKGN